MEQAATLLHTHTHTDTLSAHHTHTHTHTHPYTLTSAASITHPTLSMPCLNSRSNPASLKGGAVLFFFTFASTRMPMASLPWG